MYSRRKEKHGAMLIFITARKLHTEMQMLDPPFPRKISPDCLKCALMLLKKTATLVCITEFIFIDLELSPTKALPGSSIMCIQYFCMRTSRT